MNLNVIILFPVGRGFYEGDNNYYRLIESNANGDHHWVRMFEPCVHYIFDFDDSIEKFFNKNI